MEIRCIPIFSASGENYAIDPSNVSVMVKHSTDGFSSVCRKAWEHFGFVITNHERYKSHVCAYTKNTSRVYVNYVDNWWHDKYNCPYLHRKWNDPSISGSLDFEKREVKKLRKGKVGSTVVHTIASNNFLGYCTWRHSFRKLTRRFRRRCKLRRARQIEEFKAWVPALTPVVASYL